MNNGQWIAVWEDTRNGGRDIYGQNVKLDGTLGPIQSGSVVVSPDTLWFTLENYDVKTLTIKNNFSDNITVTYIESSGDYWIVDPLPTVPIEIPGYDSINLSVGIIIITDFTTQIEDYYYDEINITTSAGSYFATIAIDSLLLVSTESFEDNSMMNRYYPNPFNNQISFDFYSAKATNAEFIVLNSQGSIVMSTGSFNCNAGKNIYQWDGKTNSGVDVPTGVYSYRLKLNDRILTGRIVKIH
jgi:hypothetical protein